MATRNASLDDISLRASSLAIIQDLTFTENALWDL